jgi:ferredoxin
MKVEVNDQCSGHGRCFILAPEVYRLDDNGYNADRGQTFDVAPGHEDAAALGIDNCPEAAINAVD